VLMPLELIERLAALITTTAASPPRIRSANAQSAATLGGYRAGRLLASGSSHSLVRSPLAVVRRWQPFVRASLGCQRITTWFVIASGSGCARRNPIRKHAADGQQEPLGGVVTFGESSRSPRSNWISPTTDVVRHERALQLRARRRPGRSPTRERVPGWL